MPSLPALSPSQFSPSTLADAVEIGNIQSESSPDRLKLSSPVGSHRAIDRADGD